MKSVKMIQDLLSVSESKRDKIKKELEDTQVKITDLSFELDKLKEKEDELEDLLLAADHEVEGLEYDLEDAEEQNNDW